MLDATLPSLYAPTEMVNAIIARCQAIAADNPEATVSLSLQIWDARSLCPYIVAHAHCVPVFDITEPVRVETPDGWYWRTSHDWSAANAGTEHYEGGPAQPLSLVKLAAKIGIGKRLDIFPEPGYMGGSWA